jgi:hypothetical protein
LPVNADWGSHTLQARARDVSGTLGSSEQVIVWVDTAPPHGLTITPTDDFYDDDNIPNFIGLTWGATDGSGVASYDVQYRVDHGPWTDWLTQTDHTVAAFGVGGEPETLAARHTYYFRLRAVDSVRNLSGYSLPAFTRIGQYALYLPCVARNYHSDLLEPNNTIDTARGPLKSGLVYRAYLGTGDPDDFYFIDVSAAGRIVIDLDDMPSGTDFDLYLYILRNGSNGAYELLAWSDSSEPDEHIDYATSETGRYYVRVYPFNGSSDTEPYRLQVTYPQAFGQTRSK